MPRRVSHNAVDEIVELTPAREAELRRRHQTAPDAVQREAESLGVIYQRGEIFPHWPAWLATEA